MKQIKTIVHIADAGPEVFDNDVNKALAEGWKLVKREVLPPDFSGDAYYKRRYYAELEKDDTPEQLAEASQELVEICKEIARGVGELIGAVTNKLTGADEPEELPPSCDCTHLLRRDYWEAEK